MQNIKKKARNNSAVTRWLFFILISISFLKCQQENRYVQISYHDNGKIKTITSYKNDTIDGRVAMYTKEGILKSSYYIKDGQRVGKDSALGFDGESYLVREYHNGVYHGTFKNYYKNGILMSDEKFVHGKVIYQKVFYPNGSLMHLGQDNVIRNYFFNGSIQAIYDNRDSMNIKNIKFNERGEIISLKGKIDYLTKEDSLVLQKYYPNWQENTQSVMGNVSN